MRIVHRNYRITVVVSKELTSRIAFDLIELCITCLLLLKGGKVSYRVGKSNGWWEGFDNFFRRDNNNSEEFLNRQKKLRKKKKEEKKDLKILSSLRSNFVFFFLFFLFLVQVSSNRYEEE